MAAASPELGVQSRLEALAEEARDDPQGVLDALAEVQSSLSPTSADLAMLLAVRALALSFQEKHAQAARIAARAEQLARTTGALHAQARARLVLARVMIVFGQLEVAEETLESALVLAPEGTRTRVGIESTLASLERRMGHLATASERFDRLLVMLTDASPAERAILLINAASTWWQVDRIDDAAAALVEAKGLLPADRRVLHAWVHAIGAWVSGAAGDLGAVTEKSETARILAPDVLAIQSSAIRARLEHMSPSDPTRSIVRTDAMTLMDRCRSAGQLHEVAELAESLAEDARRMEDPIREGEFLRAMNEVARERVERSRQLLSASEEARASLLAWHLESELVRTQAAALAEANARLEALAASRSRLLRAVAHDLRSPLTAILLGLDAFRAGDQKDLVDDMRRATRQLTTIIDRALSEASIHHGTSAVEPQSIDLRDLVEEVFASHRLPARRKGVTFTLEAPKRIPCVLDPVAVQRVLHNLIANAVRFTHPDTVVRAVVQNRGAMVMIDIEDRGPGFGTGEVSRLLLDAVRGPNRESEGHGLGLHTVYRLATTMGGTVSLSNRQEGGARVTVRLPRVPPS